MRKSNAPARATTCAKASDSSFTAESREGEEDRETSSRSGIARGLPRLVAQTERFSSKRARLR
jgi:hypothetical protein